MILVMYHMYHHTIVFVHYITSYLIQGANRASYQELAILGKPPQSEKYLAQPVR